MNHVKLILRALLAPVFLAALLAASTSVASASPPHDGLFIAVAPARIADTRPAPENVAVPVGKVGNGTVLIVPVAGPGLGNRRRPQHG